MSDGWVRVTVPRSAEHAIAWQVHIGEVLGVPGETIATSPGHHPVEIEANIQWPHGRAAGRLKVTVPIEAGRVTEVRLPVPEPLLRAVHTEPQPARLSWKRDGTEYEADALAPQLVPRHEDLRIPWLSSWQRRSWITFVPRC